MSKVKCTTIHFLHRVLLPHRIPFEFSDFSMFSFFLFTWASLKAFFRFSILHWAAAILDQKHNRYSKWVVCADKGCFMIHLEVHFESGQKKTQSKNKMADWFSNYRFLSLWLMNCAEILNLVVSDQNIITLFYHSKL